MAIIQDSKHADKTAHNNLISGARTIILGWYPAFYQQAQDIVEDTACSPLAWCDVEQLNHQDDCAAACLFSTATLEYLIHYVGKSSLGFSIYLFIFGELIDAYQSWKVSHAERAIMVLHAKFFKDLWKSFLQEGKYSAQHYFISHNADKIFHTLVHGLLGLIFIHCDFLGSDPKSKSFPLMPWTHGSESNEHIFGIMHSLISDFTMLDVIRMIPKLTVRLQVACRNWDQSVGNTASGYSHTYFHDEDAPLSIFSNYPSDEDIRSLAAIAHNEACYLWSLLGYEPSDGLAVSLSNGHQLSPIPGDSDEKDSDKDLEDNATISEQRELLDTIEATSKSMHSGMSWADSGHLHECTFATAALNLQDFSDM